METNMTDVEIAWLAGILEGEGCFDFMSPNKDGKQYPRIRIEMKDEDIIERVHGLLKPLGARGKIRNRKGKLPQHSETYLFSCATKSVMAEILPLIHPFMGKRRREIIDEQMVFLSATES